MLKEVLKIGFVLLTIKSRFILTKCFFSWINCCFQYEVYMIWYCKLNLKIVGFASKLIYLLFLISLYVLKFAAIWVRLFFTIKSKIVQKKIYRKTFQPLFYFVLYTKYKCMIVKSRCKPTIKIYRLKQI